MVRDIVGREYTFVAFDRDAERAVEQRVAGDIAHGGEAVFGIIGAIGTAIAKQAVADIRRLNTNEGLQFAHHIQLFTQWAAHRPDVVPLHTKVDAGAGIEAHIESLDLLYLRARWIQ